MKRLTKICRWLTPGVDEIQVFESLRASLFDLAAHPDNWVNTLPQAIRLPKKSEEGVFDIIKQAKRITGTFPALPRGIPGLKTNATETKLQEDPNIEIFIRLPETMDLIERLIETNNRVETYLMEIDTVGRMRLSFKEWRELKPSSTGDTDLMFIPLPRKSL